MNKFYFVIILPVLFFIVSCQTARKTTTTPQTRPSNIPQVESNASVPTVEVIRETPIIESSPLPTSTPLVPKPSAPSIPPTHKVGIIIGPGFLRSYLAAGILQEFHKAKLPVHSLIGFEWGSLPAAIYAQRGQAHEVEWQMMKLNETSVLKKSLLRGELEGQSVDALQPFLTQIFSHSSFEQTRFPFECLTFDYKKKQYFWMKKGEMAKALSYCLSSPPFLKPNLNQVGAVDLKLAAESLRARGATFIIFINPISGTRDYFGGELSMEGQVLWSLTQYQLLKTTGIVDFVVDTSVAPFSMLDFSARRDMIRKGQEIGIEAVKKLSTKLGL